MGLAHGRNLYQVTDQLKYSPHGDGEIGDKVDFPITAKTDQAAAKRYLKRTINLHDLPKKITIDKSGTNTTIKSVNIATSLHIKLRQYKLVNNIVGRDCRSGERVKNPTLGFKSFWGEQTLITGIESKHIAKKGQLY